MVVMPESYVVSLVIELEELARAVEHLQRPSSKRWSDLLDRGKLNRKDIWGQQRDPVQHFSFPDLEKYIIVNIIVKKYFLKFFS